MNKKNTKTTLLKERGEFLALSWYGPFKEHNKECAVSLKKIGVTGTAIMEDGDECAGKHLESFNLYAAPILDSHKGLFFVRDYLKEAAANYVVDRNKKWLIRKPCINNPSERKAAQELIYKKAEAYDGKNLYWLSVTNEPSVCRTTAAFDFCFCEYCKNSFNNWLTKKYVSPINLQSLDFLTTDNAKAAYRADVYCDLSRWFDFRRFMAETFIIALNETADTLRSRYPDVKIAVTGLWPPGLFGGIDWESFGNHFDLLESYDECGEIELVRSFYGEKCDFIGSFPAGCTTEADKNFWEYSAWYFFIHGYRAIIIDKLKHLVNIKGDNSVTDAGKSMYVWLDKIQTIYAPLLADYKRIDDEILLFHSFESMSRAWIEKVFAEDEEWAARPSAWIHENDPYLNREQSWYRLIEDSGRQFKVVSAKIGLGEPIGKGKVLVLPCAVALCDSSVSWIRQFMQSGGLVIHDSAIALFDENLRKRATDPFPEQKLTFQNAETSIGFGEGAMYYCSGSVHTYSRDRMASFSRSTLLASIQELLDSRLPSPIAKVISERNDRIELTFFYNGDNYIIAVQRNDVRRMFGVEGVVSATENTSIDLLINTHARERRIAIPIHLIRPTFVRTGEVDTVLD